MSEFFSLSDLGLAGSSAELLQSWLDQMQTAYPNFVPSAANLDYIQAQVLSSFAADLAQLCSSGGSELFRVYGTTLAGVPYQQGVAAEAVVQVTAAAAPATIATTSAALSVSGAITGIPVIALTTGIAAGTITLAAQDGSLSTQAWTTVGANQGDTSIPVTSQTPNYAYPAGSTLSGQTTNTLAAFTQLSIDNLGFTTVFPVTITSGTSAGITVIAVQSGTSFNGAGSQGQIQFVQQFDWIASTAMISVAASGVDPEDDAHYLTRLTTALTLQRPNVVTAQDFAVMSTSFVPRPGTLQELVGRATAIDGYNPANGSFGNTKMVTVCVTDDVGNALNNDTMYGIGGTSGNVVTASDSWGVAGWLQSMREINFIVNVIAPTYSVIYVAVTVKSALGWSASAVQSAVSGALTAYLSPTAWGLPNSSEAGSWLNITNVYRSAIESVIQQSTAVDHIVVGTLALSTAPNPTDAIHDLVLPGPAPLPTSSAATIAVTVI